MILASVLLLLQDSPRTAEEWLARMEATMWESPSFRIQARATGNSEWSQVEATLERRSPALLRLEFRGEMPTHARLDQTVIADGHTIAARSSLEMGEPGEPRDNGWARTDQEESFVPALRALLTRVGFTAGMTRLSLSAARGNFSAVSGDPDSLARLRDLVLEGDETIGDRRCARLSMDVVFGSSSAFRQTLWVDRERFVPLRRVLETTTARGESVRIEEAYTNVMVGAGIPDDRFRIPE